MCKQSLHKVIDHLTQVKHSKYLLKYYKAKATLVYQYYRGIQYKKVFELLYF